MSVYTRRFCAIRIDNTSQQVVFITPVAETFIIRSLLIANENATELAWVWLLVQPQARTGQWTLFRRPIPAVTSVYVDCRVPLEPNEQIISFGSGPNYTVAITGYQFD